MEDTQAITVRLPRDTYERLRYLAFDHKMKIAELIRQAVEDFLTQEDSLTRRNEAL